MNSKLLYMDASCVSNKEPEASKQSRCRLGSGALGMRERGATARYLYLSRVNELASTLSYGC